LLDKIRNTGQWISRDYSAALETHLDAITPRVREGFSR
jgi:hypothetical protein